MEVPLEIKGYGSLQPRHMVLLDRWITCGTTSRGAQALLAEFKDHFPDVVIDTRAVQNCVERRREVLDQIERRRQAAQNRRAFVCKQQSSRHAQLIASLVADGY